MRVTAIIVLLAALVLLAQAAKGGKGYDLKKSDDALWKEWLGDRPGRYGKNPSKALLQEKNKIFKEAARRIRQLQKKAGTEAVFDLTDYADMSDAEFRATRANLEVPAEWQKRAAEDTASAEEIAALPTSKNWVSHPYKVVTGVTNQGSCGSCWTFATAAAVEGAWAVTWQRGTFKMSEKQILDCTVKSDGTKYGCKGGWPGSAFEQLRTSKNGGLRSTASYGAYAPSVGACKTVTSGPVAKVAGSTMITANHEAIKAALVKYGPLAVCVDATNWGYYRGGILSSTTCGTSINHAVTLVGYGSRNGIAVWVIKNSWGTGWGNGGYAYIRRSSTSACAIHKYPFAAKIVPPPVARWSNYGSGFQGASRSGTTAVFHAGLVTTGTAADVTSKWVTNPLIRRLSPSIAPRGKRVFATTVNANTFGRVDVFLDSARSQTNVTWASGGAGRGWVSLDSIVYSVAAPTAAAFTNGYVNYGGGFEGAGYVKDSEAVFLAGLVKHTAFPVGKALFVLPVDHRPEYHEAFVALANGKNARVDVFPAGGVVVASTSAPSGWLSLSNVFYYPAGTVFGKITTVNYWAAYGSGFAPPGARLGADSRVFLRGLIKLGRKPLIGTLAATYRPAAKRMFLVACSTGVCRIDIANTGAINLVGKTYGATSGVAKWPSWVSLSGIAYDATPDTAAF